MTFSSKDSNGLIEFSETITFSVDIAKFPSATKTSDEVWYKGNGAVAQVIKMPKIPIKWHNCYSFGNGVESNRIRDDFNAVTIDK